MKKISLLLLSVAVLLTACGESQLPSPTGKGRISAINAIPQSPSVLFLIEERSLANVNYQETSGTQLFDNFSYKFNFDIVNPGAIERTRVATEEFQVETDKDYILLLTGQLDAPDVTIWENDIPEFAEGATNLLIRFAHTAASYNGIDFYLTEEALLPDLGAVHASLTFGNISEPVSFEPGSYVITLTAAGDAGDILYQSVPITYTELSDVVIAPFDGDENDIGPLSVKGIFASGGAVNYPNPSEQSSSRYIHAAFDAGLTDVYIDADLLDPVLEDHAFGDVTDDLPDDWGTRTISYTEAGNSGNILTQAAVLLTQAVRVENVLVGADGTYTILSSTPDRRSISNAARVQFLNTATNFGFLNIYAVDAGTLIDDVFPNRSGVGLGSNEQLFLTAGQYDLYVTPFDEKTILDGPVAIDVALGDVLDLLILDKVETSEVELRFIPVP
ncbi:MAG: DUF4397 domain-containing protein [Woeseiaceae bacterium]